MTLLTDKLVYNCKNCPSESVMDEKFMMPVLVSSDLLTEWKAFLHKKKGLTLLMWN